MKLKSTMAALALVIVVLSSLGKVQAQIRQILPINYGVTGVRGDTNGNVLLTGGTDSPSLNTNSPAFLYYGQVASIPSVTNGSGLYLFHAFGNTNYGSQFYGPNTSLYDPSLGAGNIRAVGAYKDSSDSNAYQHSMIYTGPLNGSGSWTNIVAPGDGSQTVGDTIAHSTMGDLVVGNFVYTNALTHGFGFIYNMTNQSYLTVTNGTYGTTLYGVWHNGGSKYTIVGGYSDVTNGGKAFIENYDSSSQILTNFASFSFNNDPSIVTHFEGISAMEGGFSVCATEAYLGTNTASYAFIATNSDGSFDPNALWTPITNNLLSTTFTTGDTVISNTVLGIYTDGTNGAYSYMTVTVPESGASGYLVFALGGLAAVIALRHRRDP